MADKVHGIHYSFIVGVAVLRLPGVLRHGAQSTLRKQGIDLDALTAQGGH
jgi:hypothetical protein